MGTPPGDARRIAVAVLHSDPPQVFLAESDAALARVLALRVVAQCRPGDLGSEQALREVRQALLDEQWVRAVELWLLATDEALDAYPSEEIVWDHALDDERAAMEIRLAPVFDDADPEDVP